MCELKLAQNQYWGSTPQSMYKSKPKHLYMILDIYNIAEKSAIYTNFAIGKWLGVFFYRPSKSTPTFICQTTGLIPEFDHGDGLNKQRLYLLWWKIESYGFIMGSLIFVVGNKASFPHMVGLFGRFDSCLHLNCSCTFLMKVWEDATDGSELFPFITWGFLEV